MLFIYRFRFDVYIRALRSARAAEQAERRPRSPPGSRGSLEGPILPSFRSRVGFSDTPHTTRRTRAYTCARVAHARYGTPLGYVSAAPTPRPAPTGRTQVTAAGAARQHLAAVVWGVRPYPICAFEGERALRPIAGVQSMLRAPSAAQPFSDSSEAPSLPRPSSRLGARCLPLHTSFCTATSATAALRMAIPSLPSFPPRRRILSGLPLATVEL